jgi:hypothetical protein
VERAGQLICGRSIVIRSRWLPPSCLGFGARGARNPRPCRGFSGCTPCRLRQRQRRRTFEPRATARLDRMRGEGGLRSLGVGHGGRDRRASDAAGIPTSVSGQLPGGKPSHGPDHLNAITASAYELLHTPAGLVAVNFGRLPLGWADRG